MGLPRHSTNLGAQDRCRTTFRALKCSLLVMLAVVAMDGIAGSATSPGTAGQSASSSSLDFTIVIPAVLILDPSSGRFYSNDARAFVSIGSVGATRPALRAGHDNTPMQEGQRRAVAVNAWRTPQGPGTTGFNGMAGRIAEGQVICLP